MIWNNEQDKLFKEWCRTDITDKKRLIIYKKLHNSLFQMLRAILKKNYQYSYSIEIDIINRCLDDILIKSIGYCDNNYNSFSMIYKSARNWYYDNLVRVSGSDKIFKNNIRETEHSDIYGYDNLFINNNDNENDNNLSKLINFFKNKINEIEIEIKNREKKNISENKNLKDYLIYIIKFMEFIEKYQSYNPFMINEYISDVTGFPYQKINRLFKKLINENNK